MSEPTPEVRPLTKSDYEALAAFRRRLRRFLHVSEEGARLAGVTPQQHQLLLAIKGQPGREWMTVADAADWLQITHHAAVGLADRCERLGLIERCRDSEDRRQVRLVLTAKGNESLSFVSERNRNEYPALLSALKLPFLD